MRWRHSWLTLGSAAGACVGEGRGRYTSCGPRFGSAREELSAAAQRAPSRTKPTLWKTGVCAWVGRVPSHTYTSYMRVFIIKVTRKLVRYGDVQKNYIEAVGK